MEGERPFQLALYRVKGVVALLRSVISVCFRRRFSIFNGSHEYERRTRDKTALAIAAAVPAGKLISPTPRAPSVLRLKSVDIQ